MKLDKLVGNFRCWFVYTYYHMYMCHDKESLSKCIEKVRPENVNSIDYMNSKGDIKKNVYVKEAR